MDEAVDRGDAPENENAQPDGDGTILQPCPQCGAEGSSSSSETELACPSCGFSWDENALHSGDCECSACLLSKGEVSLEDFDEACAELHESIRRSTLRGTQSDVPFSIAPSEWVNEVEAMVRDVLANFGLQVKT